VEVGSRVVEVGMVMWGVGWGGNGSDGGGEESQNGENAILSGTILLPYVSHSVRDLQRGFLFYSLSHKCTSHFVNQLSTSF